MANKQSTPPTIAITGATGFVGTELCNYFQRKGWRVVALVRDSRKRTSRDITYRNYDLEKPLSASTLKGVDYLIHTAYAKNDSQQTDAFELNTQAARNLLKACRQAKVRHLVFMSSMSAHDSAESVYGKQKMAIENIFQGYNATSLRAGLIIGNGGIVKKMFNFMRSKHLVPLIGGGKQPLQIVAVYDLARVIDAVITGRHFGLLTVATPSIYSYKSFYQAIAKRYSIGIAFVPIPFWFLLTAVKSINMLRLPLAVNADSVLGLKQLKAADTASDLQQIDISLDSLDVALQKTTMT